MGEAKTRAERRRAEREAASQVVIIGVDEQPEPPSHRYRQKVVEFVPEIYAEIEKERELFNKDRDIKLDFNAYVNGLLIIAIERERHIREQAEQQAKLVKPVAANIVEQVLAKNRAAMEAKG